MLATPEHTGTRNFYSHKTGKITHKILTINELRHFRPPQQPEETGNFPAIPRFL
jgi:hypothetical protein